MQSKCGGEMVRRALFFDRDGVVNESPQTKSGYVLKWSDFRFVPGMVELIGWCRQQGWLLFLVTSQRCVAKGLLKRDELEFIHDKLQFELGEGRFDEIFVYDGLPENSEWEKPKPGMILEAARKWNIDLQQSCLVGDADRDIAMGAAANLGCTIRILSEKPVTVEADYTVRTANELRGILEILQASLSSGAVL